MVGSRRTFRGRNSETTSNLSKNNIVAGSYQKAENVQSYRMVPSLWEGQATFLGDSMVSYLDV